MVVYNLLKNINIVHICNNTGLGWFAFFIFTIFQKCAPPKHLIFDYIGEWFKNIGTFIGFLRSGTFFRAKF